MPKVIDEGQVFSAALEMLVAHGYERATTRRIADVAGVNEVTLFRKYGSKARLYEKVIEHQLSNTALNSVRYTGNLAADLVSIVHAYISTNEEHGSIIPLLLLEIARHPDLQRSFKTPWRNIQGAIAIIRKYQEQGLLSVESPLGCLGALIGPILTSQMFRQAGLDLPVPVVEAVAHVDAFLNGRRRR